MICHRCGLDEKRVRWTRVPFTRISIKMSLCEYCEGDITARRPLKGAIVRSIYANQISEATGEKDPYQLRLLEYVMKDRHPTLDGLTAAGMERLAVWAQASLRDESFRELIEFAVPKRSGE